MDDAEMVQVMLADPDATASFEASRPWTVTDRDGLGATLSKEAVDDIAWLMAAWVDTRLLRALRETGIGPQQVQVTVTVQTSA